ncbi:hypothetical protein CCACVL1_29996 [Corchorus capsularis]|uniref:Uncharacterized protein n=1 Tax=Corchorus capsularis TaxID=210143 RepID=A0A1R3FZ61_COCAP|nr:hypothetical protein CCACVL1_29996 [Corchorus capsularis]
MDKYQEMERFGMEKGYKLRAVDKRQILLQKPQRKADDVLYGEEKEGVPEKKPT